ncbi:Hypothetical predicted protein, partial [Marmota monax]
LVRGVAQENCELAFLLTAASSGRDRHIVDVRKFCTDVFQVRVTLADGLVVLPPHPLCPLHGSQGCSERAVRFRSLHSGL